MSDTRILIASIVQCGYTISKIPHVEKVVSCCVSIESKMALC
jgi:hypothetical protein